MNYDKEFEYLKQAIQDSFMSISRVEIAKRWKTRVVPNGWHTDPDGAEKYLAKYGKNIGTDKLKALAEYARSVNSIKFAEYCENYIKLLKL